MISKKMLGYRLFGLTFSLFRLCPVFRNKTFLIATHDDSPEGNIALAAKAIKRRRPKMRFIYLRDKSEGLKNPFSFFFVKAFHMATSSVILLDDTFLPMAYTPISKKTRVIQLWHGTGTIKRFGPEVERGELQKLAIRGNRRITTLAVNGKRTKKQYAQAFCINPKRIRITGLPRTDLILNEAAMQAKKKEFYAWCRRGCRINGGGGSSRPQVTVAGIGASDISGAGSVESGAGWIKHPDGYRYILYAPTFRDSEVDNPRIAMDIERV
ncbi:MAG: CDP-glycerol glycerophosphotransferase family protein, partial [Eubacterium sp.]|nr:CDP-glycerol glycerophosphotransferase family protein [Eubacterium sp.]